MHPFVFLVALSSLLCAACGGAIVAQTGLARHGRGAALAMLGCTYWGACQLLFHTTADPGTAILLARASAPGWSFIGAFCLRIATDAADSRSGGLRWTLRGLYAASFLMAAIAMVTPWVIQDVRPAFWGYGVEPGPLFLAGYVVNMTGVVLAMGLGIRQSSSLSQAERRQLPWIVAAIVLPICSVTLTDVVLPVAGVLFPPLGAPAFGPLAAIAFWLLVRFGYSPVTPLHVATEILEILPDGVALLHADGRVRFANEGLARMCGAEVRELLGRPIGDLLRWSEDAASGVEGRGELTAPSGGPIPVSVASALMHDRKRNVLGRVIVVRDLQEIADLRSRLVMSARLAAVGELAAGIAHEINNPLAFVRSNLSQLEEQWKQVRSRLSSPDAEEPTHELVRDCNELIEESLEGVDRAAEIVRGVKSFAHAGSAGRERTEIGPLLDDVLHVASAQLRRHVTVVRDYADVPPILCSPQQLRQVFLNLVLNAAQAIRQAGTIRVTTRSTGSRLVVSVEDDGCGIAPDLIGRIFDPFFTTKRVGEGTGLGLGIAYQIVESHGGDIEVTSQPGRGTVFRVRLPL